MFQYIFGIHLYFFGKQNKPDVKPPDKEKDEKKHQNTEKTKNEKDILIHSDKQKETPEDIPEDSDKDTKTENTLENSDKKKKPEDIIKHCDNLTTQAPIPDEELNSILSDGNNENEIEALEAELNSITDEMLQ